MTRNYKIIHFRSSQHETLDYVTSKLRRPKSVRNHEEGEKRRKDLATEEQILDWNYGLELNSTATLST